MMGDAALDLSAKPSVDLDPSFSRISPLNHTVTSNCESGRSSVSSTHSDGNVSDISNGNGRSALDVSSLHTSNHLDASNHSVTGSTSDEEKLSPTSDSKHSAGALSRPFKMYPMDPFSIYNMATPTSPISPVAGSIGSVPGVYDNGSYPNFPLTPLTSHLLQRKRRSENRTDPNIDNKKTKPVPEEKKDDAYWERRRKNNEAAKRSRDTRRQKEEEIAMRAAFLEQENLKLRAQVAILKNETAKLHYMLYNRL